jgi:hypothetical protein
LDGRGLGLFNDDDPNLKVIRRQIKVTMVKKHKVWLEERAEKGIAVNCFWVTTTFNLLKTEFLICKNLVRNSQETHDVSATQINRLMILRE